LDPPNPVIILTGRDDGALWTLVVANDKNFARIKILKTLCRHIETAMNRK